MNYFQDVVDAIKIEIPDIADDLAPIYALLVLVKGEETSMEDVHDAWSAWTNPKRPDHKSLVWFDELTPEIQEYDRKYMNHIHDVARDLQAVRG